MRWLVTAFSVITGFAVTPPAVALEPRDVFVIFNKNMPESRDVAVHYCQKRGVPLDNLIELDLPKTEDISRDDYNHLVAEPLRNALKPRWSQAKVLLTVYGVPLRVGEQTPSEQDTAELIKLRPVLEQARAGKDQLARVVGALEDEVKQHADSPMAAKLTEKKAEMLDAERKVRWLERQEQILAQLESQACVDSELMLLWWPPYPLSRWTDNVLYWQYSEDVRRKYPPVLMTARLDGPTPSIAKRLVDDAIAAEQKGLDGKVYIDARGIRYNPESDPFGTGYGGYDESFRELARLLGMVAKMDVRLDDQNAVFPPGSCPDCALYCGWYSLMNYNKPSNKFVKGAVAWHLASAEAISLRNPGKQWAGNLLRDGAAATIGPVAEPYTLGFPKPEEFFGFLITGKYTLVECYARTTMFTSWMMVLVGDPLYNPYAKSPKLAPDKVWASPLKSTRIGPG